MNSLFHVNVCDLPDVHGAKLSKITIVFLNSLVLQDLLAKASQKFLESRWRLTKFAIQMLDQAVWRQTSPLKSHLSTGLQALDAVQPPQKTERLDPYNGARDDAGELFWSPPNSSKSQGLIQESSKCQPKKGSLIAF